MYRIAPVDLCFIHAVPSLLALPSHPEVAGSTHRAHRSTPALFDACIKDVLNLMTDNIYPLFIKQQKEASAKRGEAAAVTESKPQPASGGCCVIS